MSKRYSGKSFKDNFDSKITVKVLRIKILKKPKFSLKEKRKIKREKRKKEN